MDSPENWAQPLTGVKQIIHLQYVWDYKLIIEMSSKHVIISN